MIVCPQNLHWLADGLSKILGSLQTKKEKALVGTFSEYCVYQLHYSIVWMSKFKNSKCVCVCIFWTNIGLIVALFLQMVYLSLAGKILMTRGYSVQVIVASPNM